MFQDSGECHALVVPEGEQNRWLKRANRKRAAAHAPVTSSGTPVEALSAAVGGGAGRSKPFGPVTNGFFGNLTLLIPFLVYIYTCCFSFSY